MPMAPSDKNLLRRIAEGDAGAFETLCERHEGALRRHLQGIVRDEHAADDLLQEAFLRVWMRAGQWQGEASAKAWIFRIATNLALNHLRSVRRRRERPLEVPADPLDDTEESYVPGWLVDASSLGPHALVEQAERSELMRMLVDRLPADKREVTRLVYIVGMEVRQAAERLGIPEGTAKSRLYHARQDLAREWERIENRHPKEKTK
jgi:RNA polymerase sigma-70 factor (ECF subfamily)